jgi:hypothetical protein
MTARDVFNEYLRNFREFLEVNFCCTLKGWAGRKESIEASHRVALLNCDIQMWRFDFLWDAGFLRPQICRSLSDIFARLNKDWSDEEELALKAANLSYREALIQREVARAQMDSSAVEEPALDASRDREQVVALDALGQKARSCDAQLQKLSSIG